jgi:hypothetical protein
MWADIRLPPFSMVGPAHLASIVSSCEVRGTSSRFSGGGAFQEQENVFVGSFHVLVHSTESEYTPLGMQAAEMLLRPLPSSSVLRMWNFCGRHNQVEFRRGQSVSA